jgi:hypothetical protein
VLKGLLCTAVAYLTLGDRDFGDTRVDELEGGRRLIH